MLALGLGARRRADLLADIATDTRLTQRIISAE
jgi:hypothetical protein